MISVDYKIQPANYSSGGALRMTVDYSFQGGPQPMRSIAVFKPDKIKPKLWYLGFVTPELLKMYEKLIGAPQEQKEVDQSPPIVRQAMQNHPEKDEARDFDVDKFLRGGEPRRDPSKGEDQKNPLKYLLDLTLNYDYKPSKESKGKKKAYDWLQKKLEEITPQMVAKKVEAISRDKYTVKKQYFVNCDDISLLIKKTEFYERNPVSYLHPQLKSHDAQPSLYENHGQPTLDNYVKDVYTMSPPPITRRPATHNSTL